MTLQFVSATRDNFNTQIITDVGTGALYKIYSGTPPATVATALSGNTLLATLTVSGAFGATSGGVLTLTDPATADAVATGTASFLRITTSGGTAKVQGTVGTSGTDFTINTTSIVTGGPVEMIGTNTITAPGA